MGEIVDPYPTHSGRVPMGAQTHGQDCRPDSSHVIPLPSPDLDGGSRNRGALRSDGPDLRAAATKIEVLARQQPGPRRWTQPKSRAADLIGPRNIPRTMRSLASGRIMSPTPSTSKSPPPPLSPFETPPRLTKVPTSRLPSGSSRFSIVSVSQGRTRRSGQLARSSGQADTTKSVASPFMPEVVTDTVKDPG
jgi:hypothetical protein